MVENNTIELSTKGKLDIIDISTEVEDIIARSNINNGIISLFAFGSTATITTIEYESGLVHDLKSLLEKIAPYNHKYRHHEKWNDDNGASHLLSSLLKTSLVIPFIDKKMTLGTWQQVIFIELDTNPRNRKIICQLIGD